MNHFPEVFAASLAVGALLTPGASAHDRTCSEGDHCTSWSRAFVYPSKAFRLGLEGTVGYRLLIGTDGHVRKCQVLVSSGHEILDDATCDQLKAVAHFYPARDENGQEIEGTFDGKMIWQLPREETPALR